MNQKKNNTNQGFTLLETIIYLALFSIIIGGGLVATYQIIEGTTLVQNRLMLIQNTDFISHQNQWQANQKP